MTCTKVIRGRRYRIILELPEEICSKVADRYEAITIATARNRLLIYAGPAGEVLAVQDRLLMHY